jgi:hypothetical protein
MKTLNKPHLCIGNFELWILGRQIPEADDYWDGNWLVVAARCTGESAVVEAGGPIIHLSELQKWLVECKQVYASLSGEAHLSCMEPNLDVKIKMENRGQCELSVSLTPNPLNQQHSFIFELDQSYLPLLIQNLESILQAYPLKEA